MHRSKISLAGVAFVCLAGSAEGRPPANPDPSFSAWFQSLDDPETTLPCCDEADCRPVEDRIATDHYEVLISGAWTAVPDGKIIRRHDNPTGRAILCYSKALGIMCFVPGPGA